MTDPYVDDDVDAYDEREADYVHDPDEWDRPGHDAHTNNLRDGFRWDVV